MNKTKILRKQNNEYEKSLPEETRKILTDIVVYLKSFPISEYQVELVRLDITRMLLEGAARGASPTEVLGDDYTALCDHIVAELPPRTLRQTIAYHADILALGIAILMPLWMVTGFLKNIKNGDSLTYIPVSAGTITATLLILVVSYAIVQYICKTSLDSDKPKEHGKKADPFLSHSVSCSADLHLPSVLLQNTALRIHFGIYILGFLLFSDCTRYWMHTQTDLIP